MHRPVPPGDARKRACRKRTETIPFGCRVISPTYSNWRRKRAEWRNPFDVAWIASARANTTRAAWHDKRFWAASPVVTSGIRNIVVDRNIWVAKSPWLTLKAR